MGGEGSAGPIDWAKEYATPFGMAVARKIAALQRLESACRREHGSFLYESECPICDALAQIDQKST